MSIQLINAAPPANRRDLVADVVAQWPRDLEAWATLGDLARDDVEASRVARLRHAQPVCEPGFAAKIPPVETPIRGLQIADTCFYYPEDRGISESVRFGREMAARVAA